MIFLDIFQVYFTLIKNILVMFPQLSNQEDEIIYDDFKDDFPYKLVHEFVCDKDWKFLWSYLQNDKHPIAYLILERFRMRNYLLDSIKKT